MECYRNYFIEALGTQLLQSLSKHLQWFQVYVQYTYRMMVHAGNKRGIFLSLE